MTSIFLHWGWVLGLRRAIGAPRRQKKAGRTPIAAGRRRVAGLRRSHTGRNTVSKDDVGSAGLAIKTPCAELNSASSYLRPSIPAPGPWSTRLGPYSTA